MEPTPKRRGFLGGLASSLFGQGHENTMDGNHQTPSASRVGAGELVQQRKEQAPSDSKKREEFTRKDGSNTLPKPRADTNGSFESPVKRASASQLSSRRLIGRPQGPSSKLSQSISASDFGTPKKTNFSMSTTIATRPAGAVTRMPGDNPNKMNTISGSSFSSSSFSSSARQSVLPSTSSASGNLFRASSLRGRPDFSFSPKVSHNSAMNQSFPPATPGRPPRGSSAEINGRSLAHTSSSNLFEMRIPSPPRDLSGERLAKEVPEDKSRVGSIYASEFLAHYCPPDFDDLQRRQFFCVLDLRRLKYAADEVFAKKDWKINILNFAKEYEKSRSLIMLRYGLYEFKTVKASEAVKKQWKKEHNIPLSDGEEDDEEEIAPRKIASAQTPGKRKAEEQLMPNSAPLGTPGFNKRAVTERERDRLDQVATPGTAKRKANDIGEPDENPPSKLQKAAATPSTQQKASATKSIFEKIANGTPKESSASNATSIFAKESANSKPASIFAKEKPVAANPFAPSMSKPLTGKSILNQAPSLAPSSNIFAHLSDTSKPSSNDEADGESDSGEETASDGDDANDEAEESEAQDASQSDEPSVVRSGGVSTPQFGFQAGVFGQKATQPVSSASSDAGGSTQGRSLFDRVSYDKEGQPVRAGQKEATPLPTLSDDGKSATPSEEGAATPVSVAAPAAAPANKTWSTNTPIKFAPGPSQTSASSLFASSASKTGSLFGAPSSAPKGDAVSAPAITFEPPTPAKEAEKPATPAEEPKPASTSQSVFGAKPAASNPFGATASPASNIFASSSSAPAFGSNSTGSSLFGQAKPTEDKKSDATPEPATSASLFGSKQATPVPEASKPVASPLFGAKPAPAEAEAAKPATTSLFGAKPAESEAAKPASIFQSSSLFGSAAQTPEAKSPTPQPSTLFGGAAKGPDTSATTSTPAVGFSFGASSTPSATPAQSMFGAAPSQSSNLFGGANNVKPGESTPLFGSTPAASGTSTPVPAFGAASASQEPAKPQGNNIFANPFGGNSAAPAPAETGFKFGASQSTVPSTSFGASQPQNNGSIFGNVASGGSSFAFNAGGTQDQASFSNPFAANNGTVSAPSSFTFGNPNTDNSAAQSSATPFTFGGAGAQPPSISFGAGSGASTPTSTQPSNMFGAGANGGSFTSSFTFGGSQSQPNGASIFSSQPAAPGSNMFAGGLAPAGGTSTGTSSPFFGGASSMATTPAAGTPEAVVEQEAKQETQADGDDAPQEQQISLTEGALPGEEDDSVVHEVKAKALKLEMPGDDTDGDSPAKPKAKTNGSPWTTKGIGPLRVLKNKSTGKVRMLLRAHPGGHVVLNKLVLPNFTYKPEANGGKYIKITTTNDSGKGLETWMLQVKTKELAQSLADALETHKSANKKE